MREHGLGPFGRADLHPRRNPLDRQGRFAPQPGGNSLKKSLLICSHLQQFSEIFSALTAPFPRPNNVTGMRNSPAINHFPPTLFSPNRSPIYGEAHLFSPPASRLECSRMVPAGYRFIVRRADSPVWQRETPKADRPCQPGAADAVETPGTTLCRVRDTLRTGVPGPNFSAAPTKGSSQSTLPWGA